MKKLFAVLITLLLAAGMVSSLAEDSVRLGGLKGPTTMGLVKLLKDNEEGETKGRYIFTMAASPDELVPLLMKGEMDLLAVPANLAAVLYNNTKGNVRLVAAGAMGVLYVMEKGGDTVHSIKDLKGKTLYAPGKGTTPEMALDYLLSQNGLTLGEDVQVEWVSEATEAVQKLSLADTGLALLPQPFAAVAQTKVEGLHEALSFEDEWNALKGDSRLVTAVVIASKKFAEEQPDKLAQFLQDYENSVLWISENTDAAAGLVEEAGIVKAPIAKKALPKCNLVCLTGEEMRPAVEGYLKTLFDQNPKAVGGQIPDDAFYHAK